MVITLEDLRKNETKLCGSFLKMVEDVKAMATDPSEQQVLLTQMVLNELMMKKNKNKPEAGVPLGFPKKKKSGSRRMKKEDQNQNQTQTQTQTQKKRIIIKIKRCVSATTGTASYSCSVSSNPNPGVVVNPDPLNDDQKQDLKSKSKKRCYSEIGNEGFEGMKSKRLRGKGKNSKRVVQSWVDESWTVDCLCGVTFDDGEEMVNCDECDVWVHTLCSWYVKGDDNFVCYKCKSRNHSEETVRMESLFPPPPNMPTCRPLRLWTDIPMEERSHVQGGPGPVSLCSC